MARQKKVVEEVTVVDIPETVTNIEVKPVDNTVECHHCAGKGTINGGYKICPDCQGACKFEL